MSILEAFSAGVVQGLTEFIPVSSSGHLVFIHSLFGMKEPEIFFDVCLHFAAMGSVLIFFREDIKYILTPPGRIWLKFIAIGTAPAVIAGLLLQEHISGFFMCPRTVSIMLLVTGSFLAAGHIALNKKNRTGKVIGQRNSFLIGLAQAAAIVPGLSRSGLTISTGLFSGVNKEDSFRFSFLLSVPIIAGATFYKLLKVLISGEGGSVNLVSFSVGMATAFIFGIIGLFFLKKAVKFKKIWIFSAYCFAMGFTGLFIWR